jgi:tRNA A-37 threonylcarbamoyl transferase component Bud32/cell division septation protein DedD
MPDPLHPESLERIGRFKVRRYIAGGGMAWVFEVEDPGLFDARRALKLLKPGEADAETLRRFRREAELLSRLEHPNLVHIYEFGEDPGTGCQYYTMDFIEGRTLAQIHPDWLQSTPDGGTPADGRSLEQICRYFLEVLSALGRLHAQGIVHRDIKPQNVFVDAHGRAVLGDLGVAKLSSAAGETQKGVVPGTPLYMAPEQSLRFEVSTRTDLFSLGLALYRVLTGRTVYDAALGADSTNSMAVLRHLWSLQGAAQEFEFDFPPEVPEALRAVVRRACRMNPEERFASADAMAEALAVSRRADPPREARGPRRFGVAAVAALGVLVLALGFWIGLGSVGGRSSARSARSTAEAAHAQAAALVGGLSSRSGAGVAEAIEDARRRIEYAGEEQKDAEQALQAMDYRAAEERFTRASDGYTRACQSLLDRWLRAAAAAEVGGARAAVGALPAAADLGERAQGLGDASGDAGCTAAEAERARLFAAESLRSDALKLLASRGIAPPPVAAPAVAEQAPPVTAAKQEPALAPVSAAPPDQPGKIAAAPNPAPREPPSRPQVRDSRDQKRAIEQLLVAWNNALNARDWRALAALQKLRPGQLERYQSDFAKQGVRQQLAIDFVAGFDSGRIDVQVVVTREEKTFVFWRTVSRETRKAIVVRDGSTWKIDGL